MNPIEGEALRGELGREEYQGPHLREGDLHGKGRSHAARSRLLTELIDQGLKRLIAFVLLLLGRHRWRSGTSPFPASADDIGPSYSA